MNTHLFDLHGKTAVVLGGTSGIGRAIALGLAKAGADVIAASRRIREVEQTAGEIESLGRCTLAVPVDVLDRRSLEKLQDEALSVFGRIDILVNCAGITQRTPTLGCTENEWN